MNTPWMNAALAGIVCLLAARPCLAQGSYSNFEARQQRPICLSPDRTRLFVVNTPDSSLSVFDVSNPANPVPVLIAEIPVGIEPVSVNARSNTEAWVVNEVSDSVSVVSVPTRSVVDTLACPDEPADVVFAGNRACVSCSRNNTIRIFDASTHQPVAFLPVQGLNPRALAASADGSRLYAAFSMSGNKTTLLPVERAPNQPNPTNTSLPAPPKVSLIVDASDSRLSPKPNLPDNDVVEIDLAASPPTVVRYFPGLGTTHFALATRPGSSDLWVANTDSRNLIRFEPVLKGHAVDNRLTRLTTGATPVATVFDLNPGLNYTLFPNTGAKTTALAQPTAIEFEPDGSALWLASFGTDRVARISATTGAVLQRIEIGNTPGSTAAPKSKRGPRGLALDIANSRLFVLNRISNTISVVSLASQSVLAELAAGSRDPTPGFIRQGRGFLYDAKLSGNGTMSCASCHIDGDRDELAWDLGDPSGTMATVQSATVLVPGVQNFSMHPMKGPMITQTLKGLQGQDPLHWRGDRATFGHFNGAFATLLGGFLLSTDDMTLFRDFINTILYSPNPNQKLDRTLPVSFAGGDPAAGRNTYINDQYQPTLTCNVCHSLPTGSNRLLIGRSALQESQDFKVPQLRNMYQKSWFVKSSTATSLSGFGLVHDGTDPDLTTFLSRAVFGTFSNDTVRKTNLNAFLQCLDTGTAPSIGYARTHAAAPNAVDAADWATMEAQAVAGNCDLVLYVSRGGERHGYRFSPNLQTYEPDSTALPALTRAAALNLLADGAVVTVMGAPVGSGVRLALDRNADGVKDGDAPLPVLDFRFAGGIPQLAWPADDYWLVLERSADLGSASWQTVTLPRATFNSAVNVEDAWAGDRTFYRLRRP